MKKFANIILNVTFFSAVTVIAFAVATIALTKKVNEYKVQYNNSIQGTVIKQSIPLLSFSQGIVKKLYVRPGQSVKKNDLLVELDNPVLVGKIEALQKYPDNVSAQTEAQVAMEELKGLKIYAPVNGVVKEIEVSEGSPLENLAKIMILYSNDNIELLANLTNDQYLAIQHMREAQAYSPRLNQNFSLEPDILQPDEQLNNTDRKTIGLYFTFKDKNEAASLLDNEDLQLQLTDQQSTIHKPIDFFVNFWDSILSKGKS